MRLEFPTKLDAQTKADAIHTDMIAADGAYASSASGGQTTAWAKPYQDLDERGVPINSLWYINCKERIRVVLSAEEQERLKPYGVKATALLGIV
jgi:hypothetical protein